MFFFVLFGVFVTSGGGWGAQLSETANCDPSELQICVDLIPRTQVGLPRTRDQLDAHCMAYNTGMACMEPWMKRCLPTDEQKFVHQQIGGARALMRFLCANDSALRREFLRDPSCLTRVSPMWTRCVDEIQVAVRDITERAQLFTYFNRNAELCCARDAFLGCVAHAGRSCTGSAAVVLRRMALVLAQDVAACSPQPRAYCAAPGPPVAGSIATLLSTFILYPRRL